MLNIYQRRAATFRNELRTSCGALVGIVQGLMADEQLNDQEIRFLHGWLKDAQALPLTWPCTVICAQVSAILEDGIITEEERDHLAETLRQLVGGKLDEVADAGYVSKLPLDRVDTVEVSGKMFCFTGDFVFGPRKNCEKAVELRGGSIGGVTKKLHCLVVGGLGSPEWKHGSFGTKIEKAIQHKQAGVPLLIVHEDVWAGSLHG